jgi:hypothetical protein
MHNPALSPTYEILNYRSHLYIYRLQVAGITVDWIAQNVYWTDPVYSWIKMAPIRQNDNNINDEQMTIVNDVENPLGIVVHAIEW